jgi:hypothetical protein
MAMRRTLICPPQKGKAPSFLHALRMVERAYSRGADVRSMMAIVLIDVNTHASVIRSLPLSFYAK